MRYATAHQVRAPYTPRRRYNSLPATSIPPSAPYVQVAANSATSSSERSRRQQAAVRTQQGVNSTQKCWVLLIGESRTIAQSAAPAWFEIVSERWAAEAPLSCPGRAA